MINIRLMVLKIGNLEAIDLGLDGITVLLSGNVDLLWL